MNYYYDNRFDYGPFLYIIIIIRMVRGVLLVILIVGCCGMDTNKYFDELANDEFG